MSTLKRSVKCSIGSWGRGMDEVRLTWEQLSELLDEFRDWYEFEWLNENMPIDDKGMSAPDFYIQLRRKDPCWPDRPPGVTMET